MRGLLQSPRSRTTVLIRYYTIHKSGVSPHDHKGGRWTTGMVRRETPDSVRRRFDGDRLPRNRTAQGYL